MSIDEAAAVKAVQDGLDGRNVPIVHEEIRVVLAMALERDALRARAETAERDLDMARGLIARLGDPDSLESLWALLRYERARVAELERAQDAAFRDAHRAEADAARLREALRKWERVVRDFRAGFGSSRNADDADNTLLAFSAALASAPSVEPEDPDYSGLCSAPECGGHCGYVHARGCEAIREYLADHGGPYKAPQHLPSAEPTPRDMRVAEAVREAYDRAIIVHGRLAAGALDLAAVVAKAVGP